MPKIHLPQTQRHLFYAAFAEPEFTHLRDHISVSKLLSKLRSVLLKPQPHESIIVFSWNILWLCWIWISTHTIILGVIRNGLRCLSFLHFD